MTPARLGLGDLLAEDIRADSRLGRVEAPEERHAPGWGTKHRLETMGGMAALGVRTVGGRVRPPFVWRGQFVLQCIFILRVSLIPIVVSIAAWGFSGPGLQAGNFLVTLGSIRPSGRFLGVATIREFGTFVTATILAGIV